MRAALAAAVALAALMLLGGCEAPSLVHWQSLDGPGPYRVNPYNRT